MTSNATLIELNYYGYEPNEPFAYFGAAFFGVCFFIVVVLNVRFKSWFSTVIPVASAMNVVGFALRPYSANSMGKYIVSVLCVLLSPKVFAMADYTMISSM
jgi:hypothetical protein